MLMHALLLITSSTCLLVACVLAENNTTVQGSGVFVKVLGQSGKVIIGWQPDVQSDKRRVELTFASLQELDGTLQNVQPKSGQHSFNTFSSQVFKASPVQQGTIGNTNSKATFFTFNTQLAGLDTSLAVTLYILGQDGSLTLDAETTPMKAGDVKMSMEVTSWAWCTTANCNTAGAYLDVTLTVKSQGIPVKKAKDNSTGDAEAYNLGYGTLLLSKKVKVDNEAWHNMAANFPEVKTEGDNQVLRLRLPKFSQKIIYDPTVSGELSADQTSGSSHVTASLLFLLSLPLARKMLGL